MLEVKDLVVTYGAVVAVHGLSLTVKAGQSIALLGANGAGKTSSVEAIAGLIRTRSGRVSIDGRDVTGHPASTVVRRGLALVPQWRELFRNFSVEETLIAARTGAAGRGALPLEQIYALFPVLAERRRQIAGSLSGGEQQMLAIGRALVTNPRVILLDEPSAGLAVGVVRSLVGIVRTIRDSGVGVLLVEQNLEIAQAVAEDCIVLSTGREVWRGPMREAMALDAIRDAYFA